MADMQASVPELQNRTFCTLGTNSFTRKARATSKAFGTPKLVPRSAAAFTAAMILGCACPRMAGPQVPT
jgi:hypothetical protein